ncbi:MAG TPA: CBS domain-containing protein [Candidatus Kapabacteria bacterium]|nr:CBS domain-containing protein [Candidatus Kapabacteria bacterium]
MEISLFVLFYIMSLLSAFQVGIISYLSQEKILDIIEADYSSAKFLRKLKVEFDYDYNGFNLLELAFISISLICLHSYLNIYNIHLGEIYLILTIILYLVLRTILKSYGIRKSDELAIRFHWLMRLFYLIFLPIYSILNPLRKFIEGAKEAEESRDEISELVETAHEEGAIDLGEYRILKNIMNFSEVLVIDVMTPRTVIFSCEADKLINDVIKIPELQMYSRFPIWEGESIDDGILGYVMSRDILLAALNGKNNMTLRDFCREVYFIPENARLDIALERFLNRRQHLFIVVDEYGGVEGLITMEDVLETILGTEILDEADKVADLRQLAKQRRDSRIASIS